MANAEVVDRGFGEPALAGDAIRPGSSLLVDSSSGALVLSILSSACGVSFVRMMRASF